MMNWKTAATAALVLVSTAAFAAPDAFDKYAADITILQASEVQKELKVSQAQRNKLNVHAKWFEAEQVKLRKTVDPKKGATEADQKKFSNLLNSFKDKVVAELSAVQLKRLREISLQNMGHVALLDDKVSAKVGLSKTQLEKLRNAYKAMAKKVSDAEVAAYKPINDKYKAKKPKDKAEEEKLRKAMAAEIQAAANKIKPTIQKLTAGYKATLDATLLADQKKKWSALQGVPFKPKK